MEPETLPRTDTALYDYHVGAPAAGALRGGRRRRCARGWTSGSSGSTRRPSSWSRPSRRRSSAPAEHRQRLVPAYGDELVAQAEREPRLVALDADLARTCGLIEFRERFPERFFECGIAEQDMVSQAGAMALAGLLPAVHSFACFLSTRPNEQIYNNATEGTKVIYAGSLGGPGAGGPGHSHQSVRDIAAPRRDAGHGADRAVLRARGARGGRGGPSTGEGPGVHPARQRALGPRLRAARGRGALPGRGTVLREAATSCSSRRAR